MLAEHFGFGDGNLMNCEYIDQTWRNSETEANAREQLPTPLYGDNNIEVNAFTVPAADHTELANNIHAPLAIDCGANRGGANSLWFSAGNLG
jgi:hypothetical protein